jgi:hypothetical protein
MTNFFHTSPSMLQMQRKDGRASAFFAVRGSPEASGDTANRIVFNRYGETYFLAQVGTGHDQQVHECFKCRGEQALAAQYKAKDVRTVTVAGTTDK